MKLNELLRRPKMKRLKVMTVFGTRPDAIKMAPLVKELEKYTQIDPVVCVTAQHRQMLDQVLNTFRIVPHYDLNIMQDRQTLEDITTHALLSLSPVLDEVKPDIVLVHGDTATCFVASLAAFYKKISVGHVEAGLRTFDKYSPFPEEMNRKLTGTIADFHFAPTLSNRNNLLKEGIKEDKIYVTGNTAIDALKTTVHQNYIFENPVLAKINFGSSKVIAVTAHRRENLGQPLENICTALGRLAQTHKEVEIVYAVHLNPIVQETAKRILGNRERVHLIAPLDAQEMHNLMNRSYMVMTDSGGLQEEAPSLGKPVLVLRNETERPEAVAAGTVRLAGTDEERIVSLASALLDDAGEYEKMAKAVNPYGDGKASERIVKALLYEFGLSDKKPEAFRA
jgi:UDP-N-acetylglucosamine 2-epimerase